MTAPYNARIFYIHGCDTSQKAYIYLSYYSHSVKVGYYKHNCKNIDALINIDHTHEVTISKVVIDTSKDLLSNFLLCNGGHSPMVLSLQMLEPSFDSYKELNSPSFRNRIYTFKYLPRFGIIDGIIKLRDLSNCIYVQKNMFLVQGNDSHKVFIFKISKVSPGSGVDLVRRMQFDKDLEHA